ncbi:MAG: hypothetical protein U9O98_04850 [Asgard group archaeon]|nr:hypothetical protein [Asgard group archaeon]
MLDECITKNKIIKIEYSLPIKNKNVWFESRLFPILEEGEKTPSKVISIIRDVTKWKEAKFD